MYKLLALSLIPFSMFSMSPELRIKSSSLMAPANTSLIHDGSDFIVERNGTRSVVNKAYVNPRLVDITRAQLMALQKNGYIKINPMDKGYSLDACARAKGGGFYTGWLFYTVTKSSLYGVIAGGAAAAALAAAPAAAAAAGGAIASVAGGGVALGVAGTATTSVLATNAAAAAALGAGSAAAAALPGLAVGAATTSALGAGGGAAVLGAVQTGVAIATMAGEGTAAVVVAGTATMAAIEVASLGAGAFGTAIAWLP